MSFRKREYAAGSIVSLDRNGDVYRIGFQSLPGEDVCLSDVLFALRDSLKRVSSDDACRALILDLGSEGFDFGSEILEAGTFSKSDLSEFTSLCSEIYEDLAALPCPTIAAIKDECFGVGFELAVHCDLRVVQDGARIGLTGVNFGIAPHGQAIARLRQLVGDAHTRMMALTGAVISGDRAFVMGLVTNVLEKGDFEAGLNVLSNHLSRLSKVALLETKKIVHLSYIEHEDQIRASSARALAKCLLEEPASEGSSVQSFDFDHSSGTIH